LYRVKLKNLGHINITSIIKRRKVLGGEGGVPAYFFLRPARKFPRFPADIPEISWKFRNCPFWENFSGQCKGLFQAQKRKITMTSKENRNFCHSVVKFYRSNGSFPNLLN
jgi:hypothetical protein